MIKKILQSANGKLYLLLAVTLAVFLFFTASYLRSYYGYYMELYQFRKNLIASLTTQDVGKPEYVMGDPYQGSLNSKIIVFEYGDMSCEACKAIQPALRQLQDFYGQDKMALIWKDFPITPVDTNIQAHEALHCANDQNAFPAYQSALYAHQGAYTQDLLENTAKEVSLDQAKFNDCLVTNKYQTTVENNYRDAIRIGLDSAPTIFINNTKVDNDFSFDGLRKVVESTK